MLFCPNCGSRLTPQKTKVNEKVCLLLQCAKCGYVKQDGSRKIAETLAKPIVHNNKQELVTVIPKEAEVSTMPTMKMECPKCGNRLCFVWQVQTRGGDEAMTQFFRCTKCSHTFRIYS
jgi:DNA-directed RNA polymerase subunit M